MLGHDGGSGQRKQPDVLEFGRDRKPGHWRASRLLLAALVIVTGLVVYVRAAGHHSGAAQPTPALPTAPAPPPVRVISAGHRLLGVRAGWQLFARGPDDLLRIQLSQGRVTWTYVPPIQTGNPAVAFVLTAHEALIRPADQVPGYVVPDGRQARLLTGLLARGGPLLPGPPGTATAWILVTRPPAIPSLSLITLSTDRRSARIPLPPDGPLLSGTAVADGRGDALLITTTSSAVHDVGPGWDRLVQGMVIAVGQASWLTVTCKGHPDRCHYQVISSIDGSRRRLPGTVRNGPYFFLWPPAGVISPDGDMAAVPLTGASGATTVHLVSLRTGVSTDLGVRVREGYLQSMAWSPDGRWLFVASASGKLVAINARSGQARSLGLKLPGVEQVAIRP
jgi:hypothetical protein